MSEWQKCPVCDGTKLVSRPPGVPGDVREWQGTSTGPWPCPVCEGTGLVTKPDSGKTDESPFDLEHLGDVWARAVKVVGAIFDDKKPPRR